MTFVSIGDIAKQKFNQALANQSSKIVSSITLEDVLEVLFGNGTTHDVHHLYTNNGLMVLAATRTEAFEILNERTNDLLKALQEVGMKVEKMRIL